MKKLILLSIILITFKSYGQDDSCKIIRNMYQKASLVKREDTPPHLVRIPLNVIIGLSQNVSNVSTSTAARMLNDLQRSLDQDFKHFENNEVWYFEEFSLEQKFIDKIKIECPTINLKVLEDEINFYSSKYRPYDKEKDKPVYKRVGAKL